MKQKSSPTLETKPDHLVLFDGNCPICNLAVRHIITIDSNHRFVFSPLKSKIAQKILGDHYNKLIKADSMIVVENYLSKLPRIWIRSRAFLRIYWIIGGRWRIAGLLSFLPGWLGDLFYRLFAISRYRFKFKRPIKEISKDRLLD